VTGTFNNVSVVRVRAEPPPSTPRMWVDTPQQHDTLSENVTVAGWAVDLTAPGGSGVDAVHVWAYPVEGGAPVFVGGASHGHARGDVAGAFGSARFTNSGFVLHGTLPRGRFYDLVVFARSTVTGTFNQSFTVRIRVV
jgi:hypothetical protein